MRMTGADQATYRKMAYYVRHDLPRVVNVPSIRDAMRTIGQLNRAALEAALRWGHGPTLSIVSLPDAWGEFTPGTNEIRVDRGLCQDFETSSPPRQVYGRCYLLGVTLLHELVHWGDDRDGVDRPGEEGWEFEQVVYGAGTS